MDTTLPLDGGFLRRQCPNCDCEFKWHHGSVDGAPEAQDDGDQYFCPLCGQLAAEDAFHTHEQVAHMREAAVSYMHRELQESLRQGLRNSKAMTFTPGALPGDPASLFEPHDMMEVQSPCHPWEPLKIPTDWHEPIHCLVCGSPFKV